MSIVLAYFDEIVGPKVFKIVPKGISNNLSARILEILNLNMGESFVETLHIQENAKCISLPFNIEARWARGKTIDLLLTIILDKNYKSDIFQIILKEYARRIKKMEKCHYAFCNERFVEENELNVEPYERLVFALLEEMLEDLQRAIANPDMGVFLILGLSLVGKTTMIDTLRTGVFNPHIKPTLTYNIIELIVDNHIFKTIDVSGQKRLRNDWWAYSKTPDALMYVIDINDNPERIQEARMEFDRILEHFDEGYEYQLSKNSPFLICLNKIDLIGDLEHQEKEILKLLDLKRLNLNFKVQLTSGKTGEGLKEGLHWLIEELMKIGD